MKEKIPRRFRWSRTPFPYRRNPALALTRSAQLYLRILEFGMASILLLALACVTALIGALLTDEDSLWYELFGLTAVTWLILTTLAVGIRAFRPDQDLKAWNGVE